MKTPLQQPRAAIPSAASRPCRVTAATLTFPRDSSYAELRTAHRLRLRPATTQRAGLGLSRLSLPKPSSRNRRNGRCRTARDLTPCGVPGKYTGLAIGLGEKLGFVTALWDSRQARQRLRAMSTDCHTFHRVAEHQSASLTRGSAYHRHSAGVCHV